jgi:hypothetical protein
LVLGDSPRTGIGGKHHEDSATTSATLTATLNSSSRSDTLTINPATPLVDTVSITRAEYELSKRVLRVEATNTRTNATLQVFVTSTNQLIETPTNEGGGKYRREFSLRYNGRLCVAKCCGEQPKSLHSQQASCKLRAVSTFMRLSNIGHSNFFALPAREYALQTYATECQFPACKSRKDSP